MQHSIQIFLDWCHDQRGANRRIIELLSSGKMKTGSNDGSGWQDTTQDSLATSERIVAEMDDMIAKIEAEHA